MKSLKKQRRIQILVAASVALVLAAVLVGYGFRDGINLYRAPSQVFAEPPSDGEVFRLGGGKHARVVVQRQIHALRIPRGAKARGHPSGKRDQVLDLFQHGAAEHEAMVAAWERSPHVEAAEV